MLAHVLLYSFSPPVGLLVEVFADVIDLEVVSVMKADELAIG